MGVCGRSVFSGRPAGGWRQAPFGSRPQTIVVTRGRRAGWAGSGCGGRHLLARRRGLDRCEGLVAELAQDVVGAAAELARDRQTGAVVVDPPRHLTVVVV